ncbi:MAG: hypothetical protein U0929_07530 [Planctomycetaceae bacterium]
MNPLRLGELGNRLAFLHKTLISAALGLYFRLGEVIMDRGLAK